MTVDALSIVFALVGSALGFAADAIAHRWPAHEDGYERDRFDWRSATLVLTGTVAFGALGLEYGHDASALLVYVPLFAVLLLLLATDLDQRLLPDIITLPLIAVAAVVLISGYAPALAGKEFALVSGIAAAVVFPLVMLVLDRVIGGELGLGDVKLSVSLGLLFGLSGLIYGMFIASIGFAIVLIALIAVRRLTLKSAIPFGPVLIFAGLIAALSA
jgi:leader peptidase (prepilin peptidase)/N-methyltransferase